MSKTIYFFRTVKDGSRDRLRPMPYQTDETGHPLITDLNVQADTSRRQAYPLGTVFASEMAEIRTSSNTPFYAAGDIFPVSIDRHNLQSASHEPTDEMIAAYNSYMAANASRINPAGSPSTGVFGETATAGKPLSLLDKLMRNPDYEVPTLEKDGFYVSEDIWYDMMLNIIENQNTLLKGPAGSGKTELVMTACRKMGIPCRIYDMGSMYDPVSEMLGVHRIGSDGVSVFDYAQFTQDIQHEGVILLDELSRATPAVNNILLPVLDSRRRLRVEMAGAHNAREIPVHPKCRFIATANIGAEYTGVQGEMDRALLDRLYPIELDYMPGDKETQMLTLRFKIARADALNIVNTAATVRNIAAKEELSVSVSTRETIMAARKVRQGYSAQQAMEKVFLPLYSGTKAEGERAVVWNAILAN